MKICIDTNTCVAFRQGDGAITELLESAEEVFIPSIVIGELYTGFYQGRRIQQNVRGLKSFLDSYEVSVVPIDAPVAERYAAIVKQLREAGDRVLQRGILQGHGNPVQAARRRTAFFRCRYAK